MQTPLQLLTKIILFLALFIQGTSYSQITLTTSSTNITCNGFCDGTISCNASGPNGPFQFSLNGGANFQADSNYNFTALCVGVYSVVAQDTMGQVDSATITITEPGILNANINTLNNESSPGSCDGFVEIIPNGGTIPYSYYWNNASTTNLDSALCSGNYWIDVTDANGCQDTAYFFIDSISNPCVNFFVNFINIANESSPGMCDGVAEASVSGGTAPYTYLWSPTGHNIAIASSLCAGNHTVTVTDNNACQINNTVFIDSINNPCVGYYAYLGTIQNESSPGACDGFADIYSNGGTAPFTYSWSNSNTTNSDSALCAGNYWAAITDNNGCSDTLTFFIDSVQGCGGFNINLGSILSESSPGACDGYADIVAGGGTAPYSFNWSNSNTTSVDSMLCAGNYSVTVTDNNGCSDSISFFIDSVNNPCNGFSINIGNLTNASPGLCDGSAYVIANGGQAPYYFQWSTGDSTGTANSLCYGNYNVVVNDNNGCSDSLSVFIDSLVCNISISISNFTNVSCFGKPDGSISVNSAGGVGLIEYSIDAGATTQTLNSFDSLAAGTYVIYTGDTTGCLDSIVQVITEPSQILIDTSGLAISGTSCSGQGGSITGLTISGGSAPYSYQWTGGASANNSVIDLNGATSGSAWMLNITDASGCQVASDIYAIGQQNSTVMVSVSTTDVSCAGVFDGQATASATGGIAPYTYQWFNGAGNTANNTGLMADSGWVQAYDVNGCASNQTNFVINEPIAMAITETITPENCGSGDGTIFISVSGGTSPYSYSWSQGANQTDSALNLVAGQYEITVADANGCNRTKLLNVANNNFSASSIETLPSCNGGNDGNIDLTVTPAGAYTFLWSNGATTEDISGLEAGYYSVTIDDGSCHLIYAVDLLDNAPISIISSAINSSGCSTSDGQINLTATGGTGTISYSLYGDLGFIGSGTSFSSLLPGAYMAMATDINGCTDSSFISISGTQGSPINILIDNISAATCSGSDPSQSSNGVANITVSGGNAPYQFYWRKYAGNSYLMSTAEDPTTLSSGEYVLEVRDQGGCSSFKTLTVEGANLAPQSICLVTVEVDNFNNQTNLIVWEKNQGLGISKYEIWREEANGNWQKRGTILFSELSQFSDNGVDPNAVSYKYRLKTIDECNNVSVFQAEHRTMQLAHNNYVPGTLTQDGSIDLSWNAYIGINNISGYVVERTIYENGQSTVADVGNISSVSGQLSYTFTDSLIPMLGDSASLFYSIRVDLGSTCSATKAQDHNSTRSNRASIVSGGGYPQETPNSIIEAKDIYFNVYPNPSSGIFNLELNGVKNNSILNVYNALGKVVLTRNVSQGNNIVNLNNLQNGFYYFDIVFNGAKKSQTVILQK